MISETRTVDIKARLIELVYSVKADGDFKKIEISFRNLKYGTITALRMALSATDSFGDIVLFGDSTEYEIKRADLNIKPSNRASLTVEIGQYDIKNAELRVLQVVYASGEIYNTEVPEVIEYDIEKLNGIWSNSDSFDRDALEIIKEYNSEAICVPSIHPKGWICCCGYLNMAEEQTCCRCVKDRDVQLKTFSKERLEAEITKRVKKKAAEEEEREQLRKIEREKKEKKHRNTVIGITTLAAVIIIVAISMVLYNNHKYGMSKEDLAAYEIAQDNYNKVDYFSLVLGLDFYDKCEAYYIDDYKNQRNRINEAEKDKDYLYSRGMYEASALIYGLITDQYPEKYHETYKKLAKVHEGDIFNDIGTDESLYVKMSTSRTYIDRRKEIDAAIDHLEEYMKRTVFNPEKIKYTAPSMPSADYSNVYGISMGLLFYDDGRIMYIGEISDNQADGFGRGYYSSEEGGGIMCDGTFENGKFVDGEHHSHSGEGDNPEEIKAFLFSGNCKMISGLDNTQSSESVANKRASDDERDKKKASACASQYAQTVVNKQNGCRELEWIDIPHISGSYYSYSCTLTMSDGSTRKGTITVEKNQDGTFSAVGLDLD